MANILVVDDEPLIVKGLKFSLEQEGHVIDTSFDGEDAFKKIISKDYDVVLLDLMLPIMDGFDVCKKVREKSDVPIIILSARGEDISKIKGLEIGADDYITKPFNPLEVLARVKTQLRRYVRYNAASVDNLPEKNEYDQNGLVINKDNHKCMLYDTEITLTPIEFSILWYLCEHKGKVVSAEELFEAVWGEKYLDNNNTVMAHIGRLREKLKEPTRNPKFIKTVWGVGYQIE